MAASERPILYIVIPCFNEEQVLPQTYNMFLQKMQDFTNSGVASFRSRILFVDDGSSDNTWRIISDLAREHELIEGLSLSRNRGHQNALLAGLMQARVHCDVSISIDCDGQDDIDAMDEMMAAYADGCDVVYGVRNNRDTDSAFKRGSAQGFYKMMGRMGVESVYNHADYRLLSVRVLDELAQFKEVNLFLRGMIPLIGFKSTSVYYARAERVAGESHYPISKMLGLAVSGITSLSIEPIRIITVVGLVTSFISLIGIVWAIAVAATGNGVSGWASLAVMMCFIGGLVMLSLGVIGEYVGRIYLESKERPRFIIARSTLAGVPVRDGRPLQRVGEKAKDGSCHD